MIRGAVGMGARALSGGRPGRLEGKVAVVTASTAGIGLGIVTKFAEEGAKVVVSSRKAENVEKTVAALKARSFENVHGVVCHVGKEQDRKHLVEETLKKYGGAIDILVSNAAANPAYGPLMNTSGEQWDKIMDINVKSSFLLAKEFIPIMQKQKSGSIVFVTSIAAYSSLEGLGAYSVSKTALTGLGRALSVEHARDGIRINCVAPGIVKTHFSQALWEDPKNEQRIVKQVPLRRVGVVDDITGAACYLASDESSYVTGETLLVTGGMHTSRL